MTPDMNEHDELLLSRMLDGDLPAGERQRLEDRLGRESAMRARLEAMTGIHTLLVARRRDVPAIDWSAFQGRVMALVEREAARRASSFPARVLRFPLWFQAMAPLAAAAAIALVVLLRPSAGPVDSRTVGRPGADLIVTYRSPVVPSSGTTVVSFRRPPVMSAARGPAAASATRVAFTRSAEQEEYIRRFDEALKDQPAWRVYTAHVGGDAVPGGFSDDSPM